MSREMSVLFASAPSVSSNIYLDILTGKNQDNEQWEAAKSGPKISNRCTLDVIFFFYYLLRHSAKFVYIGFYFMLVNKLIWSSLSITL